MCPQADWWGERELREDVPGRAKLQSRVVSLLGKQEKHAVVPVV